MTGVSFDPPLWLQRQSWVLSQLKRYGAEAVFEVGCCTALLLQAVLPAPLYVYPSAEWIEAARGATKLASHTIFEPGPVAPRRITIMDIDNDALEEPLALLDRERNGNGNGNWGSNASRRWYGLDVKVLCGAVEENYKSLVGEVDVMVATEVIEHLDNLIFSCFASSLLGVYRPRMLLMSTPNYSFNSKFGPEGLLEDPTGRTRRLFRHSDHKFEWTTDEFRAWCDEAASAHGYTVTLGGVGELAEESADEREESSRFATQTAVFEREDDRPCTELDPAPPSTTPTLELDYTFPAAVEGCSTVDEVIATVEATMDAIIDFGEQLEDQKGTKEATFEADIWTVWMCLDVRLFCRGKIDTWFERIGVTFGEVGYACNGAITLHVRGPEMILSCGLPKEEASRSGEHCAAMEGTPP